MALPWLESLHAFADVPPPSAFPKRFGIVFLGCGINEDHWSAEGQGAAMKAQQDAVAPGAAQREDQRDRRSLRQGAHRPGHSSRPDRQPVIRRAHFERRHHPLGHQRGPDDCQPRGRRHAAIQHRAGLRSAHDGLPRVELFPGLQFPHLLAESGFARSGGSVPIARLGQPV